MVEDFKFGNMTVGFIACGAVSTSFFNGTITLGDIEEMLTPIREALRKGQDPEEFPEITSRQASFLQARTPKKAVFDFPVLHPSAQIVVQTSGTIQAVWAWGETPNNETI